MVPYLARLLDITMNTGSLPADWKRAIVVLVHKGGGDRSLVTNYRPVTFTSMVCRQIEHVIASYLRVWDKNDWLYEGQHGFRPGYSCENQVITVCQGSADSLDKGHRTDAIIFDFSKAFNLAPHDRLLTKIAISGVDSRVVA